MEPWDLRNKIVVSFLGFLFALYSETLGAEEAGNPGMPIDVERKSLRKKPVL